jgi:phosphoinositide-3-kinase regulatory subunit 4
VSRIVEHTAAINEMALSPDHRFFVTCSDDGSIALFDTKRLETNPLNRSSLKITDQGGKIKCVNFCESSHSIVSASTNGSININRIEYIDSSKYTSSTANSIQLEDGDYVSAIDHCNRGI